MSSSSREIGHANYPRTDTELREFYRWQRPIPLTW